MRGTHIISLLIRAFQLKYNVNNIYPIKLISKRLLRIQLIMHLNTLIETDYKILTENGLYWSTEDWQFASMQRGIDPNNTKPEMI